MFKNYALMERLKVAPSIKPGELSPIIDNSDSLCVNCKKLKARWYVDRRDPWCSPCFISDTSWGRQNRDGIIKLAEQVADKLNKPMLDGDNRVLEAECDRILSSIVFSSLYVAARNKNTKGE
jgi:hypothetical protein